MNVADMQIWLNTKIKQNNLNLKPLVVDSVGGPATRNQKTLEFIEKAIKIHGNKYDYSLVDYKNSKKKVNFICNSCKNIFEQIPNGHLSGRGCNQCSLVKHTKESAIKKANSIHKNKYDYSLLEFNSIRDRVDIICPDHGKFNQLLKDHLQGYGCAKCGLVKITQTDYIEMCKKVHNGIYDYSKTIYIKGADKVTIICPYHGEFQQRANGHLAGRGCSKCAKALCGYKKEQFIARAIKNNNSKFYVLRCSNETEEFYKIGITSTEISNRYHCKATLPYNYEIVIDYDNEPDVIYDLEKKLLKELSSFNYKPLIYFKGISECFDANENVLKIIKENTI